MGKARRYRWLTPAECVGLNAQVANLVQDQNRVQGPRTFTADEWADALYDLSMDPKCRRGMAAAYREAIAAMRVQDGA